MTAPVLSAPAGLSRLAVRGVLWQTLSFTFGHGGPAVAT